MVALFGFIFVDFFGCGINWLLFNYGFSILHLLSVSNVIISFQCHIQIYFYAYVKIILSNIINDLFILFHIHYAYKWMKSMTTIKKNIVFILVNDYFIFIRFFYFERILFSVRNIDTKLICQDFLMSLMKVNFLLTRKLKGKQ